MKGTTSLENVIEQVHALSANHYDEIIPLQEMEFDSLTQMWVAGKQVEVAPSAQRLLSNRLRVPYSYLSRCPSELQARNLNYWIEQERQQRDTFFCRFDANRLRAVFTERYRPLDNMEILSQLIQHGFDPSTPVQYAIDDGMFLVKIPEYARAFGVNPGYGQLDEIVPGVSFANSEVGLTGLQHRGFLLPAGLYQRPYRQNFIDGVPVQAHQQPWAGKFPGNHCRRHRRLHPQAGTVQAVPAVST